MSRDHLPLKKLNSEPDGFCRINYKSRNGLLYCWQNEGYGGKEAWSFYRCSKDGEPSHMVRLTEGQPVAPGPLSAEWGSLFNVDRKFQI